MNKGIAHCDLWFCKLVTRVNCQQGLYLDGFVHSLSPCFATVVVELIVSKQFRGGIEKKMSKLCKSLAQCLVSVSLVNVYKKALSTLLLLFSFCSSLKSQ